MIDIVNKIEENSVLLCSPCEMVRDNGVLLVVLDKAGDALHTLTSHTLVTPINHILKHLYNNYDIKSRGVSRV